MAYKQIAAYILTSVMLLYASAENSAAYDHWAHDFGMDAYVQFFKDNSDKGIEKIVNALKNTGEFDNKIFIVIADHGMTAMPTGMTYIHEEPFYDPMSGEFMEISQTQRQAEMSCSLKTNFAVNSTNDYDGKNARNAELNNNNLHIWELGEVLKNMPGYKILAPKEIVKANKGETTTNDPTQASIIAAFNGPMAHIYIKGASDWNGNPQNDLLMKVADLLQATLAEGDGQISKLSSSVETILVRGTLTGDYTVLYGDINNTAYIDAINRIKGMNNKDRSGDIILIMKDHTTGDAINRYTTGTACRAWHGSLNTSDSYVPFVVTYPGGNKTEIENILKKDTACKEDYSNCKENWKLTNLITEIIKTQYSGQ